MSIQYNELEPPFPIRVIIALFTCMFSMPGAFTHKSCAFIRFYSSGERFV